MMDFNELVGMPAVAKNEKPISMVKQEQVDKMLTEVPGVPFDSVPKKMIEWFDQHYYKIAEDFFPSVTTILSASPKPYLAFWRGDVGNEEASRVMKEAGERGSIIHNAFSAMLRGKKAGYRVFDQPDVIPVFDQFIQLSLWKLVRFMNEVKPSVKLSEEIVYSTRHQYAGTMDLLFEVKGGLFNINGAKPLPIPPGLYVADIKSGKNIDDEAFWQTAAYAKAYEEMTGTKIDGTLILHTQSLNKGGIEGFGVKIRTGEDLDQDFSNFLKIYEVWKIKPYPSKPRLITDLPNVLSLNKQI